MDRKYGALFKIPEDKRRGGDKSPSHNGDLEISDEVLHYLVAERNAGREAKCRIAAWTRKAKSSGKFYLSVEVSKPYAAPEEDHPGGYIPDDDELPI